MVEELKITETEYRGVKLPSYSLLKRIDTSGPKAILEEFKGGSEVMEFGDLVDCLLLQPEELDNKFYFKAVEKPTGQILQLADYIIEHYDINPTNDEIITLTRDLNIFGRKTDETRLTTFDNDLFWNYIENSREAKGKTVFSPKTLDDANQAIEILKTHHKTANIFHPSDNIEEINQLKIKGEIKGKEVKIMMDKILINHESKTIIPYDLKCTDVRQKSFPYIFTKMKYYLQASLYSAILIGWAKENYPDYVVTEFKFIVYSRADRYPFVWVVSDTWLNNGFYGFVDYKNNKVKGVEELLEEYYYYVTTDNFTMERDFVENDEIYIL